MDGFDQTVNVKVIMATNRADTLDPALLRPGRLDRKIEFPLPDRRQKRLVFQVILWMHYIIIYYDTVLFSTEGAMLKFLVIFYSCLFFSSCSSSFVWGVRDLIGCYFCVLHCHSILCWTILCRFALLK